MIMNFVCHTIFHFPIKCCLIFLVCCQKAQECSKCDEISRFQQVSEKLLFGLDIRFYSLILLKTCKHTPKDSFELNHQFYYLLSCKLQNVDIREFWAISANIASVVHAKTMSQLFPRVRLKDCISLKNVQNYLVHSNLILVVSYLCMIHKRHTFKVISQMPSLGAVPCGCTSKITR